VSKEGGSRGAEPLRGNTADTQRSGTVYTKQRRIAKVTREHYRDRGCGLECRVHILRRSEAAARRTVCLNWARTGPWGRRRATGGATRQPKADRPGWTKAVVATHSTAGQGRAISRARRRGEPRPKGPTIKAARLREGNAGHDVGAKARQEGH
jgi:hypothetical protein